MMECSLKMHLALICVVNLLCIQVCFTQSTAAGTAQPTGSTSVNGRTSDGVTTSDTTNNTTNSRTTNSTTNSTTSGTTGGVTATTGLGETAAKNGSVSVGASTAIISNATASEAGTNTVNATVGTLVGAGTSTAGSSGNVTDGQVSTTEAPSDGITGPPHSHNTTHSSTGVNVGMLKIYEHWSGLMMVSILVVMSF